MIGKGYPRPEEAPKKGQQQRARATQRPTHTRVVEAEVAQHNAERSECVQCRNDDVFRYSLVMCKVFKDMSYSSVVDGFTSVKVQSNEGSLGEARDEAKRVEMADLTHTGLVRPGGENLARAVCAVMITRHITLTHTSMRSSYHVSITFPDPRYARTISKAAKTTNS